MARRIVAGVLVAGAGVLVALAVQSCGAPYPTNQPGPACVSPGTSPPPGAREGFSPRICPPAK